MGSGPTGDGVGSRSSGPGVGPDGPDGTNGISVSGSDTDPDVSVPTSPHKKALALDPGAEETDRSAELS